MWQSQYIADLILDYTEAKLPQAAGRAEADAASVKADILKLGKAMGTAKAAEKVREEKECLFIIMNLEITEKETKILRLLDAPRDYGKRMYRLKPFSLFFE